MISVTRSNCHVWYSFDHYNSQNSMLFMKQLIYMIIYIFINDLLTGQARAVRESESFVLLNSAGTSWERFERML